MKKRFLILLLLIPLFCISCDNNTKEKIIKVTLVNWNPFTIYVRIDDDSKADTIYSEGYLQINGDFSGTHELYIHSKDNPTEKKVILTVPSTGTIFEYGIHYDPINDTYKIL